MEKSLLKLIRQIGTMYQAIKNVIPQQGYKLCLTFENGEQKLFDTAPYFDMGIFRELKDVNLFNTFRVSFESIEWANEADFDPEALCEQGKTVI